MVVGCAHLIRRLELYFRHKEAYIRKKSCKKISAIEVKDLREYKKRFSARSKNAKEKRTERDIQSGRGSRPPPAMETKDQRGNSPPYLGGRPRMKRG